jgi:hypothetical protein
MIYKILSYAISYVYPFSNNDKQVNDKQANDKQANDKNVKNVKDSNFKEINLTSKIKCQKKNYFIIIKSIPSKHNIGEQVLITKKIKNGDMIVSLELKKKYLINYSQNGEDDLSINPIKFNPNNSDCIDITEFIEEINEFLIVH